MILPANYSITAYRNGDYREQFTMVDGAGVPIDMTSWVGRMQVRAFAGASGSPMIDINTTAPGTNGSVITLVTPASGVYELYINKLDWTGIPAGSPTNIDALNTYDTIWTEPASDTNVWVAGAFTLKEGVTR